ncbi:hypothetical protein EUGRSUZ_E00015 [Eucalyptus grandis]|uniref:Uncharacterized protein n=2 Tax=Eucalyptus grandis TaxID=71139 RepID=A0ACC3KR40_EUCGR|nr:hypothetical protein EUGRSUZ_E00015 [Eucalyptus grandis]
MEWSRARRRKTEIQKQNLDSVMEMIGCGAKVAMEGGDEGRYLGGALFCGSRMDCCSKMKSYPPGGGEKRLWCSHVSKQYPHHSNGNEWLSPFPAKHITSTPSLSLACLCFFVTRGGAEFGSWQKKHGVHQHRLVLLRTVDACGGRQGPSSSSAPEEPDPPHLPPPSPCSPLSPSLFCFRLLYDLPPCRKIARNVAAMATGEAPAEVAAAELPEIFKSAKEAWDKVEDKYAVSSLAVAGVVALWGSTGMISVRLSVSLCFHISSLQKEKKDGHWYH